MIDSEIRATLTTLRAARQAAVEKYDIAIRALENLLAEPTSATRGTGNDATETLKANSPTYKDAAITVLKMRGQPVHIDKLVEHFQALGWYTDKDARDRNFRNAVNGALLRHDKEGGLFYKSEPATYGLRAWTGNGGGEQLSIEG